MSQGSFWKRVLRIAGRVGVLGGAAGIIFAAGAWSRGIIFDKDKRELATQVDTLTATNRDQASALKTLQEENQALAAQLSNRDAVARENATLKESRANTLNEASRLERETADLKTRNAELGQAVANLRSQVSASDRRRDLLARIQVLDKERSDLVSKVRSTLGELDALRPVLASDSESCMLLRTGVMNDTIRRLSVCARATELSDKYQRLEKELVWDRDRIKTIEMEVSRLQSQL